MGRDPTPHPPRPRLTVRVGITGHRWGEKLKHEHEQQLIAQIRSVLLQVAEVVERVRRDPESGYRARYSLPGDSGPRPTELRLISALAEGADRLLVDAAPAGWRLQAILPFPVEVYQRDFIEPHSTDELERYLDRARQEAGVLILDGDRDAPNAFEPVGTAICLNSDVLIAVWNGEPGKAGGTGFVVALADKLGIPIVRLEPDAVVAPWLHRPELPDQGRSSGLELLAQRIEGLFAAPAEGVAPRDEYAVPDLREAYFAERWCAGRRGTLYGYVLRLVGYEWRGLRRLLSDVVHPGLPYLQSFPKDYGAAIRQRWRKRWQGELGISPGFFEPVLATPLPDHYGWASYLANYYAARYRSSFLWGYGLAWIAVFFAAAGLAAYLLEFLQPWVSLGLAAAELGVLLAILTVVVRARTGHFHRRWLAYRSLTERLRSLTYTLPLGRASTLRAGTAPGASGGGSWVDWMHRAVVREVGVLPVDMTRLHLREARRLLVEGEVRGQVDYHRKNAAQLTRVDRRLHGIGNLVFFGAILLALIHLKDAILETVRHGGKPLLSVGAVAVLGVIGLTGPALVASVHGFLSQGEFKETAERSHNTQRELERLLVLGSKPGASQSSEVLGGLAADAATAMDAELGAWFSTYRGKDVPLP